MSKSRIIIENAFVTIGYYLAAQLSSLLTVQPGNLTPIWIPSGLMLAIALIRGRQVLPGIFMGGFVTAVFPDLSFAISSITISDTIIGGIIGLGEVAGIFIALKLIDKLGNRNYPFRSNKNLTWLLISGVFIGTFIAALFGTTAIFLRGDIATGQITVAFLSWWIGSGIGVIVFTPFLFVRMKLWQHGEVWERQLETIANAFVLVAIGVFGLNDLLQAQLLFFVAPIIIWAILRLDRWYVFLTIILIPVATISEIPNNRGLEISANGDFSIFSIQLFILTLTGAVLYLYAAITERGDVQKKLIQLNQSLEETVSLRTIELHAELQEREKTEAALENTLNELRVILDSIEFGILLLDSDLKFRIGNKAYQKIWGIPDEVLNSKPSMKYLFYYNRYSGRYTVPDKTFHDYVKDRIKLVTEGPIPPTKFSLGDGHSYMYQSMALPDGSKMLTYFDITAQITAGQELMEARDEAESANKAKSEFLAAMSHDLRTPLNAIMGFSDMMRMQAFGPLGNEKYIAYTNDIHKSGTLLVSLINDVLDVSKVEAGKYELLEEILDLTEIIHSCLHQSSVMSNEAGQSISPQIQDRLPNLQGDERVLIQILNNFISNAIKFTPNGGLVTVAAWLDGQNQIVIEVTDTGIGMSEEEIKSALHPFEQANSLQAKRHEGTGLGLHLCSNFIKLFDGTMEIESRQNKGTTISITFPAERTVKI